VWLTPSPPATKISLFSELFNIFDELFRGYSLDILPLVLQILAFLLLFYRNGTGLNIKMIFSSEQTQNQIKTILCTNFELRHVWNAEKTPVTTCRKYHWLNDSPLQWMFKVSATSVDASVQMLAMQACRRLRKLVVGLKNTPMKTYISLNQLNNFVWNFQWLLGRKFATSMTSFVQQY